MKNTFSRYAYLAAVLSIAFGSTILTTVSVFADEPVSAPQVVAPAQPAGASTVAGTTAAATTSGTTTVATTTTPTQQGGMLQMMLPLVIMIGVMYFVAIRPQQKKAKEHQALLSGLKSGDEVITTSGILGTITGMSDKVVNLEVSKNVQIKVLKSQVTQIVKGNLQDSQA